MLNGHLAKFRALVAEREETLGAMIDAIARLRVRLHSAKRYAAEFQMYALPAEFDDPKIREVFAEDVARRVYHAIRKMPKAVDVPFELSFIGTNEAPQYPPIPGGVEEAIGRLGGLVGGEIFRKPSNLDEVIRRTISLAEKRDRCVERRALGVAETYVAEIRFLMSFVRLGGASLGDERVFSIERGDVDAFVQIIREHGKAAE